MMKTWWIAPGLLGISAGISIIYYIYGNAEMFSTYLSLTGSLLFLTWFVWPVKKSNINSGINFSNDLANRKRSHE